MTIVFKIAVALLGLLLLALFGWLLLRERIAERRQGAANRARLISQTIAREYRYRESPTWERSSNQKYVLRSYGLAAKLKQLGE